MTRTRLKKRAQREDRTGDFSQRLVTLLDPDSTASEAFRTLRTSLLYAVVDTPPRVVLTTSPGASEGKSTTCANLGVVLAQADKNTLLIDCDLRRPSMHKVFGERNLEGMTNVISGERSLSEVWTEPLPGLKVVSAGRIPPNPAEVLNSARFTELVEQARQQFDYVLIDSPPVEAVSDPLVVATRTDGVLLVLDSQRTRKSALRKAVRSLESVGARILGTVMNNVDKTQAGYYYQSYTRR
jgi:capsular exopolysaccharide synthesis family protein